jgi:hypothetical protein
VPPYRRRQSTPSSLFCVYSSTQSPGATSSSSVYTLFVQVKPSGQDATQQSILTITAEQACEMLVYQSRSLPSTKVKLTSFDIFKVRYGSSSCPFLHPSPPIGFGHKMFTAKVPGIIQRLYLLSTKTTASNTFVSSCAKHLVARGSRTASTNHYTIGLPLPTTTKTL